MCRSSKKRREQEITIQRAQDLKTEPQINEDTEFRRPRGVVTFLLKLMIFSDRCQIVLVYLKPTISDSLRHRGISFVYFIPDII